ncbi:hypothetical protein BB561_005294 [Smittium simulii]|uniref:Matrin-type domain-containing protein n=1 Tax=Smittium simulii TaxID=133385 RepID=A0A2T9YB29_9FUNG|nr:hypothetical protein BB561_005294 [Smittium simulii]
MDSQKGFYKTSTDQSNFRKTWDKEEYEKRARARENMLKGESNENGSTKKKDSAVSIEKAHLVARDKKIDLSGMVGKTQIVQVSSISAKQPGYYCKVCDCTMKDSITYLDHINGKKHHQNLNMSLKIKRDTVVDVKEKLAMLKKKIEAKESKQYSFEDSVAENKRQAKDQLKSQKEKKKKTKLMKQQEAADSVIELSENTQDVSALMG